MRGLSIFGWKGFEPTGRLANYFGYGVGLPDGQVTIS
jgi:hypothetical protein